MSIEMFEETVENIDEVYPFSLSPKIILAILMIIGIFMIASEVILIWELGETYSFLIWQYPISGLIMTHVVWTYTFYN